MHDRNASHVTLRSVTRDSFQSTRTARQRTRMAFLEYPRGSPEVAARVPDIVLYLSNIVPSSSRRLSASGADDEDEAYRNRS